MTRPEPWNRQGAGKVLLCPPASPGVVGRGRRYLADFDRVWELSAAHAWPWPIAGVRRIIPHGSGARVEGATWVHRLGPEGAERSTWAEGVDLGGMRVSVRDGLILVEGSVRRVVDVLEPDEALTIGPGGALAVTGRGLRVAPPSRTPVEVEVEVDPTSLRWSRSGRYLRVATPDGSVSIDVATRVRKLAPPPRPAPAGSCALAGHLLAGPGGRIWDLCLGLPLRGVRIRLGATLAAGDDVVNVDWESHEGSWISPAAEAVTDFRLPLDHDDTTIGGVWDGSRAMFTSAEGRSFAVSPRGEVEEIESVDVDEPDPIEVTGPLGPMEVEGSARIEGRTFVWSTEGGLYGWPGT